jgi:hypothetical protein
MLHLFEQQMYVLRLSSSVFMPFITEELWQVGLGEKGGGLFELAYRRRLNYVFVRSLLPSFSKPCLTLLTDRCAS